MRSSHSKFLVNVTLTKSLRKTEACNEPIKTRSKTCSWRKAWENACVRASESRWFDKKVVRVSNPAFMRRTLLMQNQSVWQSTINRCNIEFISYDVFYFQGGLGTSQEMCLSFFVYYPKLNLTRCLSSYSPALKKFTKTVEWVKAVKWMAFNKSTFFRSPLGK